jgi:hypothetical protein
VSPRLDDVIRRLGIAETKGKPNAPENDKQEKTRVRSVALQTLRVLLSLAIGFGNYIVELLGKAPDISAVLHSLY